jgi:hypothetical protein
MKVIPTERARQNEEVSIGFTLNRVTDKELSGVEVQGLFCKNFITNKSLSG